MANMIGAFFGKAVDSCSIFCKLAIAETENYKMHLNRHNVIFIDFSEVPEKCTTYDAYITRILDGLRKDLHEMYPETDINQSVWDIMNMIFRRNGERFIFVMDEWDAFFICRLFQMTIKRHFYYFLSHF